MTAAVAGLSASQIGRLSTSVVSRLSSADIGSLTTAQVAGFSGEQLNALTSSAVKSFSSSQVGAISYAAFLTLSGAQASNFTADQIGALSPNQIRALTASQLNSLDQADLNALDAASLTAAQIRGLDNNALAKLSVPQVETIVTSLPGALSPAQVAGLSATQLNGLSQNAVRSLNVTSLSAAQLQGLTTPTFGNFTSVQIASLSTAQIGALTATQTSGLTAATASALSQAQLGALSASGASGLSQAAISGLSTSQIGALSATVLNGLSATQVGSFSAAQTAALSVNQLNGLNQVNLNALNVANFTASQLQGLTSGLSNLSSRQVGGLSQSQVALLSTAQITALSAGAVSGLSAQRLSWLSADAVASLLATQGHALSVDQITSLSDAQVATTTLVGAAGGLQFNLSWGASAANAPAGFKQAAIAAAAGLASELSNNVVLNIQVGYGEVGGEPVDAGAAAESGTYSGAVSYAALTNALKQYGGNSSIQTQATSTLPANNPTSGGTFVAASAQAKALGLAPAGTGLDGYVGLSSAIPFQYNQKAVAGKFDAIGAFQHEFSEVMGRTASVGAAQGSHVYTALDLYRYTSTNNANPQLGTPTRALVQQSGNVAYFSIDNGATNLGGFSASDGTAGDYGDWNASMGADPFGFSYPGVIEKMSGSDIITMAVIGWNLTSAGVTHARAAQTYALV